MNNKIFIISIILVAGILILFSYESLHNYVTYIVPLKNTTSTDEYPHMDSVLVNGTKYPFAIKSIQHHEEDDSITVTFGNVYHENFADVPEFSYTKNFQVNQSFAFSCKVFEPTTYLEFYKYYGTEIINGEKNFMFWHYDAETIQAMPCNYPDVLINSIDVIDNNSPI